MNIRIPNINNFKLFFKIAISIIFYLAFALYTIPAYTNIRAYADEKIFSNKKNIVVGDTAIVVDVVDTEEKRLKGLSGKESLSENTGMLFVFDTEEKHSFWMKDMKFSIDIIWFNHFGEIIYIAENVSPKSYPKSFGPKEDSLYVLEVPSGFAKKVGLKLGDKIDLY